MNWRSYCRKWGLHHQDMLKMFAMNYIGIPAKRILEWAGVPESKNDYPMALVSLRKSLRVGIRSADIKAPSSRRLKARALEIRAGLEEEDNEQRTYQSI